MAADYYPVIFRAVSRLPNNTSSARQTLYERARAALDAQLREREPPISEAELRHERNALEFAISRVEKSPRAIPGARGSTALLAISAFFLPGLWVLDPTSMSLPWVIRPWNRDHVSNVAAKENRAMSSVAANKNRTVSSVEIDERTYRRIRWAANFFIWSSVIVLMLSSFDIFDRWSRWHATQPNSPSLETLAGFIGFIAGGILYKGWLYILLIVSGVLIRRYKSRIAAGLFVILGLWGVVLALLMLSEPGLNPIAVTLVLFFGSYLLIGGWTFIALMRLHRARSRPNGER